MPIRPELRRYYGPEHRRYRAELIALLGARCAKCGKEMPRYLNLAHTTHDPRQPNMVALWCPSCHARNDATHRIAIQRRTRARRSGQLWLFPEVEWAPYPGWMVPRREIESAQQTLF